MAPAVWAALMRMPGAAPRHSLYDGDPRKLARWRPSAHAPPGIAVWELTLRCDLGCRHCGSRAGRPRPRELSTAEALDLARALGKLGVKEVALIGGEFYLRDDWDRIAAEVTRCGMLCSVVTGARQLTPARVERARRAGIGKISISIDGLAQTHDQLRGSAGSWRAAIDAARRVAASGIDLSVNSQINRLTMPELPAIADLLVDIGARSWMVILTAAMGRAADAPALMLQPYHLLHLFPLLAAIKRERLDPNGIAFFPGNNVGYFGPLAEALRYGAERGHAWSGCAAGEATLGIEADGSIKGCPSLPSADYVRGNVRDRPLADIAAALAREHDASSVKTSPVETSPVKTSPVETWGFCGRCPFAHRCRGGCTWTSHVLFGRPGNNPLCHFRALRFAAAGIGETLEPIAPAPGQPFDHGRYRIVEAPLGDLLANDPVVARTAASSAFGISAGAPSLWSPDELADALRPGAQ
jgi:radical SAM protein with 4Fe4S-binding SPASM domain